MHEKFSISLAMKGKQIKRRLKNSPVELRKIRKKCLV